MRPEREENRSLLFIGEVKNAWRITFAAQPVRGVMRKCREWHRYRSSDERTEVSTNSTK